MNKNKYYLLQPYYMPQFVLQASVLHVFYLFVHYSFNSCMNCLLFIHLFNSEYLGSLPKFKGIFARRLRRLHTHTWPRWENSQPGQEVPLWWAQRRENIKWSLVQAVPPTMSLSSKANPESLTPSTPHSPTSFLFSQVSRDINSLGTKLMSLLD